MIVMISPGLRPNPAMLSFYVTWNRAKLQIFHVLTKLIELDELMHRGMLLVTKMQIKLLLRHPRQPNPCHANFSMLAHVFILKLTKPKVCYTSMYAQHVLLKMEKNFHIQRRSAGKTNRPKTSSYGHVFKT